ncbi:MAG: hypothetical protein KAI24_12835 [Planctomycetes bacterium]|nr:hypothetical protein [Planctomycetota bacterium]
MNTRRLLIFLVVVLGLFGCRRNSKGQLVVDVPAVVAASVLGGGDVLLNPAATASVLVGLLTLRNDTAAGTPNGDIAFTVNCPPGCETPTPDVVLGPGEAFDVQVFATVVLTAVITVEVLARYVEGTVDREFAVTWNNLLFASNAFAVLALMQEPSFATLFFASVVIAQVGLLTDNSNPLVPRRLPALAQEVRLYGAVLAVLSLLQLQALFSGVTDDGNEVFATGSGPNGFTVEASPGAPMPAGEYITFWYSVSDDIPLASPTELLQYAVVCDSDANPANNYVPSPSFPNDFFADTDRWYELNYTPTNGWTLTCKVVGPGNTITTTPSAARAILRGDTVVMVVPRSEFVVANPPFRVTTFAHTGDFGQNPPFTWSGDPTPAVAMGLQTWQ